MDLLSIVQSLWRHRFISIPVVVLTALAALYVVKIEPPTYESSASILLANPETGATPSQIAQNPALKKANPYNTFVSYGDLSVVADTLIELITSPSSQPALIQAGVDPRYTIELSTAYGNPPIIDITGVGSSSPAAIQSATALVNESKAELYQLQKTQGINPFYMITAVTLSKPSQASRSSSGKLRSLIGVLAIGTLLLFVAVSTSDAIERRRRGVPSVGDDTVVFSADPRIREREPVMVDYGTTGRNLVRSGLVKSSPRTAGSAKVLSNGLGSTTRGLRLRKVVRRRNGK